MARCGGKIKTKTEVSTEFGNTEITGLRDKNNFGRPENYLQEKSYRLLCMPHTTEKKQQLRIHTSFFPSSRTRTFSSPLLCL